MADRRKTWRGIGLFALAGTATAMPTIPALSGIAAAAVRTADASTQGGEGLLRDIILVAEDGGEQAGGESGAASGGEGGGAVMPDAGYSLNSTDPTDVQYDAEPEIAAYVAGVHASYDAAVAAARNLRAAVDALLADPTDARLAAARKAWIAARPAYLLTETFRFYDGPIEEVEGRINAWPMNEAFVDYVEGNPNAGIVNDPAADVSIREIIAENQVTDENDVTTGWHAIEFLLWGQDLDANGPGNRPATDFAAGKGNNDRRRAYLKEVTGLLVDDLDTVEKAWAPNADNYARKFLALPQREAVGRILNGMAILAGFEFMSERLAVGLDSGDQEDEHSCFSDTTHQDFVYDLKGIENVWNGAYKGALGPGVKGLVGKVDRVLAAEISALLDDATDKVAGLGDPWDKVLATPEGSPERARAEEAVAALQALGEGLKEAGARLGVLVQIPSG